MSRLADMINDTDSIAPNEVATPVMATPAAFAAGVVAGGKACAVLVAAAAGGAAVSQATK